MGGVWKIFHRVKFEGGVQNFAQGSSDTPGDTIKYHFTVASYTSICYI